MSVGRPRLLSNAGVERGEGVGAKWLATTDHSGRLGREPANPESTIEARIQAGGAALVNIQLYKRGRGFLPASEEAQKAHARMEDGEIGVFKVCAVRDPVAHGRY